jgi:hypothetical protein
MEQMLYHQADFTGSGCQQVSLTSQPSMAITAHEQSSHGEKDRSHAWSQQREFPLSKADPSYCCCQMPGLTATNTNSVPPKAQSEPWKTGCVAIFPLW